MSKGTVAYSLALAECGFSNAMRTFISMRGCPKEIRSDNGTNFKRANNELRNAVEQWDHHKISNFCTQREIIWKFNSPAASHMGGVW